MKQRKYGLMVAAIALWFCSNAQQRFPGDSKAAMQAMILQKMPKLAQASDKIQQASIPAIRKPVMVHLDPAADLQKIKDLCPFLLAQKPSLELEGKRTDNSAVKLKWETTNGWNNSFFSVERSLGDTLHFETVNYVWANAEGGMRDKYDLPDANDYNKISYYRLRLSLKDGRFLYSNTAKVKGYEMERLSVYPNPSSAKLSLTLITELEGAAEIQVFDAAGREVSRGSNILLMKGQNSKEMAVDQLPEGTYTVKLLMPDKTERTARFVKIAGR